MALFADYHDGFVLPNARFNPTATSGSGLLTPPESPKSGYAELPTSTHCHAPVTDEHHELPPSYRRGRPEPEKQSVQPDLSGVSETIYTIIEQVIEQKLAEAMGPLRLNIRRLDSENTDLQTQNDRLEQQLHALQNISVTASNNLELLSSISSQLSHTRGNSRSGIAVSNRNFASSLEARKDIARRTLNLGSQDWSYSNLHTRKTCAMGLTPVKKTPSKTGRSPARDRRSQSRGFKESDSASNLLQKTPNHARDSSFSHTLPTDEQKRGNGRVVGRSLIMWARPRMAEKLLLHLHYECTRHKIVLPWDSIAHRLHPGSSGAAVVQHLNRVRKELIREGHLVPPVCQKPSSGSGVDPGIRGFVRLDPDGEDKETTRPVRFDEKYDDLRFNLPDSFQHSGDEDDCTPDSPSPVRTQQSRVCSGPPSVTDESVTDSLRRFDQSWSPMRSFRSPTRKQRSEIDELDNPLLTRSFDTLTSVGSAPTSAPSTQSLWQEAPFPQYSPMGLYPYAKQHSEFPSSFSGYMTLPPDYSMFTAVEPFAGCQEDSGMSANCSHILGNARHEEESLTMSVDERFDDTCETRDSHGNVAVTRDL
ncbi:hypothetical protein CCM_04561 [Cordyceps militaris CM01]|uniref:Uncharacterized protein n=1 Tax=Cordyceps militaris (strain CM01) TaxID=983644 RepID=G3JFV5_CORMM|nr:uncharacterized protein CCM_04561 [Cordyceps militaris CM01]EGX93189.1 hypothetical protein CCM_04561 [Cordyceps militaris CM01]